MSRKHYIALAAALKGTKPSGNPAALATWEATLLAVADTLQADNSMFQRSRFLSACGYGE